MTQAQLDLQKLDLQTQLEQIPSDLTTQPLFNNSAIPFLQKIKLLQITHMNYHHYHRKKYEIMKDRILLSSPIYPPILASKHSLSTNCDDHLIPIPSHNRFRFKAQMTSLYMHPTDYTFRLFDKN